MARILIVEDNQSFVDALVFTLQLEGHQVWSAGSADEGIQSGLAHRPDVVIADWMLGSEVHGGEVCRRIQSACPQVKSIIMTGYVDGVSKSAWPAPGEAVIEKPFHKEDIIGAIDRALSGPPAPHAFGRNAAVKSSRRRSTSI
jgi:two-component system response regulator RegX3